MATEKKTETPDNEKLNGTEAPPVDYNENEGQEPPKKRGRGRPPGSTNKAKKEDGPKKRKQSTKSDNEKMARQICGIHLVIAQITGIPEIALSENDGVALAESVNNVCDQYDLAIDGKTGALIQLAGTAAMIYGPRVFAFHARMNSAQNRKGETVDGEYQKENKGNEKGQFSAH